MRNLVTLFFFSSLCFVLLLHQNLRPTLAIDDEHGFDYIIGSDKGPENWGDLHEDWADCKYGTRQSPINLEHNSADFSPQMGLLNMSYKPSFAWLHNRGHDIMLEWEDAGSFYIDDMKFRLEQFHWHSPSEHYIDGKQYDLEVHMVHKSYDGSKYAVIGILYEAGQVPDTFLGQFELGLKELAYEGVSEVSVPGMKYPWEIMMGHQSYFRYMGSLTTPPCSQNVIWTVSNKVQPVAQYQIDLLREAVHDYAKNNSRPLQDRNGRTVKFYCAPHSSYGGEIRAQSF